MLQLRDKLNVMLSDLSHKIAKKEKDSLMLILGICGS